MLKGLKRFNYYFRNFGSYYLPDTLIRKQINLITTRLNTKQKQDLEERVNYYVRLPHDSNVGSFNSIQIKNFKFPWNNKNRHTAYFFDLYPYIRILPKNLLFHYFAGDTDKEMPIPTLIKSRPVTYGKTNSAICRLNSLRHFQFVEDHIPWDKKRNLVVSRNEVRCQPWRERLLEMYIDNPLTDFGQINTDVGKPEWFRNYMSIPEQLNNKFIMCIRGHDVATNLKWVMSSNSLAVMPKPSVESWFQEGLLIPNVHFVAIKEDYSDLIDKIEWFLLHPADAHEIIHNAHKWINRFTDINLERATMAATVREYFIQTNQLFI